MPAASSVSRRDLGSSSPSPASRSDLTEAEEVQPGRTCPGARVRLPPWHGGGRRPAHISSSGAERGLHASVHASLEKGEKLATSERRQVRKRLVLPYLRPSSHGGSRWFESSAAHWTYGDSHPVW